MFRAFRENTLIAPVNVESWEGRLERLLEMRAQRKASILGRDFKSLLHNVKGKPGEHRAGRFIVHGVGLDLTGIHVDSRLFGIIVGRRCAATGMNGVGMVHDASINRFEDGRLLDSIKIMPFGFDTLFVVAKFVKEGHLGISSHIGDGIIPVGVVGEFMIKAGRIPVAIAGHHHVRQILPLIIGEGTELNVGQALTDADWDDVAVQSFDALQTAFDLDGFVVDCIVVPFHLSAREDRLALSGECSLMEDENDGTALGFGDASSTKDRNIGDLMAVNSSNIDSPVSPGAVGDRAAIYTDHTTVGTSAAERRVLWLETEYVIRSAS